MVRDPDWFWGDDNELPPDRIWFEATVDTAISTVAPRDQLWEGNDWVVSVFSVNTAYYSFMTTGSEEGLFAVPPQSNVIGGFGVFGSWIRRDVPVD